MNKRWAIRRNDNNEVVEGKRYATPRAAEIAATKESKKVGIPYLYSGCESPESLAERMAERENKIN